MDYMLRTATKSDMEDALTAAGLAHEFTDYEGEVGICPIEGIYIDSIGPIPPRKDIDGNIVSPGDTRWHTNIRAMIELTEEQVDSLPTFDPPPAVPYRVFA